MPSKCGNNGNKKNSNFSPLPNVTSDSRNNHNGDPWVKD